jgi:hypothetical protein
MENADNNILNWNNSFLKYSEYEKKCVENINAIGEIKKNLKNLLGNQKKDDLMFYKSLIESSYFYLSNSLKVRKIKILKDLNYIWSRIDERKQMDEVNKNNFMALIKDYNKMIDDINSTKKNNTMLTWVKNDNIESLHDLEKDIYEILEYHLKLIEFFSSSVELEKAFYCGK